MNRIRIFLLCCLSAISLSAQVVDHQRMERIYEEAKTPYKYGLVIAPQDNKHKYDCPTVFREKDKWYMTFVCYDGKGGNDGRGYETWLAESNDLLHWNILGRILEFPSTSTPLWDANQRGGFPALIDYEWNGTYKMGKYKGAHWMTYIGGNGTGYEAVQSPLSVGLASTKKDITKPHPWQCLPHPVISHADDDAQWWEQMTQYKSTIYKVDKKYFGHPFVMFYNAGGKDSTHPKGERIGIALSDDMLHWTRFNGNPVFAHDSDGTITGDAQIVRMGDIFVMFYFSAFNPTRKYNAYNTFAASHDLIHWTDWDGDDLIIPSKPYDEMFAHKSYVVKYDGIVYHFYCAVNNDGQRGIAVATSRHLGKSEVSFPTPDPTGHRITMSLDKDWEIISDNPAINSNALLHGKNMVDVPFNLDDYFGALQKEHGNLHGSVTCRKEFFLEGTDNKEYFINFEGVGTYAAIELNGHNLGTYDIGRTCECIDITKFVHLNDTNTILLNISHPEGITDMPWVCGGCSSEWGFSEGSQPFGIFRPVTLEVTDKVRIEPFGVHVWSNNNCDSLFVETEIKNYDSKEIISSLVTKLSDATGRQVIRLTDEISLLPGETKIIRQQASLASKNISPQNRTTIQPTPNRKQSSKLELPRCEGGRPKGQPQNRTTAIHLWSVAEPYLYKVNSIIKRNGKATDSQDTPFGFRTVSWPKSSIRQTSEDKRFLLNNKPIFLNGVCEYEHIFGQSHAFTHEQIETRIKEVQQAGFNAFRDAHQPHNLHYKTLLDREGILWWAQFSAHIWYDTPKFRESFKRHLRQWVKERRNSPSLVLWGLQNESTLPKDFAEECTQIIRDMDPTCGSQRLVTTCNGGEGTDWNVVQNWSGTYGGNIENYATELKQDDQLLNGEYGAWRTIGNHTGEGYTEEKYLNILKRKVELAKCAKDSVCGQFLWLLNSHDNPGRRQPDEALRRIDKVGPFNYKGLFTIWEQPVDAFYWYKNGVEPPLNLPHKGRLPAPSLMGAENFKCSLLAPKESSEARVGERPAPHYLYRVNCGGDEYIDDDGNRWEQDHNRTTVQPYNRTSVQPQNRKTAKPTPNREQSSKLELPRCEGGRPKGQPQNLSFYSHSWGDRFDGVSSYQCSQTYNPEIPLSPLFQRSRFGRHELYYHFDAPQGDYQIELYFTEPWYKGTIDDSDYEGWRLFDVAVNDSTVLHDIDIWSQVGYGRVYKRTINFHNDTDHIKISFPKVKSGQAIISAIAIANLKTTQPQNRKTAKPQNRITAKPQNRITAKPQNLSWSSFDNDILVKTPDSLLPPKTSKAIEVEASPINLTTEQPYNRISWTFSVGVAKIYSLRFKYWNGEKPRKLHVTITDQNGVRYVDDDISFLQTQAAKKKRKTTSITTGGYVNAGTYHVTLTGEGIDKMIFDKLTIE